VVFLNWSAVHLAHDFYEHFVDFLTFLGRRLNERTSPQLSQPSAICCVDLSLTRQVTFVANQEYWDTVCRFDTHNLLVHCTYVLDTHRTCDPQIIQLHVSHTIVVIKTIRSFFS